MGFSAGADGRLEGEGEELGSVSEGGGEESGVGKEDWGGEVRGRIGRRGGREGGVVNILYAELERLGL